MNVFMHGGNGLYYCRLQKVRASPEQSVNQALPKIHELKLGGI